MSKTAVETVGHGAAASAVRGGVISPQARAFVERSPHPARPLRVRSTLPLQGRVASRVRLGCSEPAPSRKMRRRRPAYLNPVNRLSNEFDCSTGTAPETSAVWVWAGAEAVVAGASPVAGLNGGRAAACLVSAGLAATGLGAGLISAGLLSEGLASA